MVNDTIDVQENPPPVPATERSSWPALSEIPLVSRVQYTEMVRTLPLMKRARYQLFSALAAVGVFSLLAALACLIMNLIFHLFLGEINSMDDALLLIVPIVTALMITAGMSSATLPETVIPGANLPGAVRQAGMQGLRIGLLTGFFFGLVWSLAIRIGAFYIQLNTIFDGNIYLSEILFFSVLLAFIVGPAYGIFRTFNVAAGPLILHRIRGEHPEN